MPYRAQFSLVVKMSICMQALQETIQNTIKPHNLLDHPFYKSWSDGTMSSSKLSLYAREYGAFIGMISELWEACGYPEIAATEREHKDLWNNFACSLGTEITNNPKIEQVRALTGFMAEACKDRSMALGAVLAFEFQQPSTVESKLEGLRTHYASMQADEEYFEVHLDDWDEPAILIKEIADLSEADRTKAMDALQKSCVLLWDALTGVNEMPLAA